MLKMGDTNLKKDCPVLLFVAISQLDTLILYLEICLHLLEIQRQQQVFTTSSLLM